MFTVVMMLHNVQGQYRDIACKIKTGLWWSWVCLFFFSGGGVWKKRFLRLRPMEFTKHKCGMFLPQPQTKKIPSFCCYGLLRISWLKMDHTNLGLMGSDFKDFKGWWCLKPSPKCFFQKGPDLKRQCRRTIYIHQGYQVWVRINPRQESKKTHWCCVIFVAKKTFRWEMRWESSQYRYDWIWRGAAQPTTRSFSHGVLRRVNLNDG